MAQQGEQPRPHGDPLADEVVEDNRAQRQSDAPEDLQGREEPTAGTRSTANGIPAGDERAGAERRRQYDGGADLVSKID